MKRHEPIWLESKGFDGLWNQEGPCGCGIKDLAPCGDGPFRECVPAVVKDDGLFYPAPKWKKKGVVS